MYDHYSHEINSVVYVDENIPGPHEHTEEFSSLIEKFNVQLVHNCECENKCGESCSCLTLSGGTNYTCVESENREIFYKIYEHKDENVYPIIECNDLCKCSQDCGNRLVQKGPIQTLFVKPVKEIPKGLCLFTNRLIKKGSFICEYAGEVLTKTEVLRRHAYNKFNGKMNYIFCLNEHVKDEIFQTFIDPSMFGNIGRYINHSCEPNCKIIPVRVNSAVPKLAVFSIEDILPFSEITFDYGSNSLSNSTDENVTEKKACLCKSTMCRGYMPYEIY